MKRYENPDKPANVVVEAGAIIPNRTGLRLLVAAVKDGDVHTREYPIIGWANCWPLVPGFSDPLREPSQRDDEIRFWRLRCLYDAERDQVLPLSEQTEFVSTMSKGELRKFLARWAAEKVTPTPPSA
jgi:hypothetical protein